MSVGVPYPSIAAPSQAALYSLIYQRGRIYTPDATAPCSMRRGPGFDFYGPLYRLRLLVFDFISASARAKCPLASRTLPPLTCWRSHPGDPRAVDFTLIRAPGGRTGASTTPSTPRAPAHDDRHHDDEAVKRSLGVHDLVDGQGPRCASTADRGGARPRRLPHRQCGGAARAVLERRTPGCVGKPWRRPWASGRWPAATTARNITNAVRKVNRRVDPRDDPRLRAAVDREITASARSSA